MTDATDRTAVPTAGPSASQRLGWVLLAYLAGIGAIPFVSAAAVATSAALGLPEGLFGSISIALVAALVAWVAGRPGTTPVTQLAVGASFGPGVALVNALVFGVTWPLAVLVLQAVSSTVGAATYVALAHRRRRLRDAATR